MMAHGYGIFPQVELNLQRPDLCQNTCIGYRAIAGLTKPYLKLMTKTRYCYKEDIPNKVRRILQTEGWDVILQNVTET